MGDFLTACHRSGCVFRATTVTLKLLQRFSNAARRMSFWPRQGFDHTVNPLTIALFLPSSGLPPSQSEVAPTKEDKRIP
jgi:hypothetical protein